jgi:putative ubiquitin-RnfH superfamily antitoxin RatB of RatAB toxin-antitoxin module
MLSYAVPHRFMDPASSAAPIAATVAYSPRAGEVDLVPVVLAAGATVLDALNASRMRERHPEIDIARMAVGIWGRLCALDAVLRDGGRVEVYRPLRLDPKEARRLRQRNQREATCNPKR